MSMGTCGGIQLINRFSYSDFMSFFRLRYSRIADINNHLPEHIFEYISKYISSLNDGDLIYDFLFTYVNTKSFQLLSERDELMLVSPSYHYSLLDEPFYFLDRNVCFPFGEFLFSIRSYSIFIKNELYFPNKIMLLLLLLDKEVIITKNNFVLRSCDVTSLFYDFISKDCYNVIVNDII